MSNSFQHIYWVIGLLFFQLFVIDVIDLGTYSSFFTPLIFSYVIFKRKLETTVTELLIFAFIVGFLVDVFRNTIGLNISVLLLVTFLRSRILNLISAREDFDDNIELNLFNIGILRYLFYYGVVLFFHHALFYLFEQFSFVSLFSLLSKALINSIFALAILILFEFIFNSNK